MEKKEFHTKEEFLLDLLAYYTVDPNKRRNYKAGRCRYYPLDDNPDTEGCAIGRHLSPENAKILDIGNCLIENILEGSEKQYLPQWMLDLNTNGFLNDCQDLHDTSSNWLDIGLSEKGKMKVQDIIKVNSLNPLSFSIYLQ